MKCPKCNGKGEFFNEVYNDGKRRREILIKCNKCHGTGEVEMTNEEWFCQLDTEDKAREISDMTAQGYWSEELVEKWLKEKHNDKSKRCT